MAVTLTLRELKQEVGLWVPESDANMDAQLTRYLETAKAWVERTAPSAPDATQNEAAALYAGWLYQRGGEMDGRGKNAGRHSGALSVLAPYRVHRAGKCERPA